MWLLATNNSSQFMRACDYLATDKSILRTHIRSVYEGKIFPCELYAYLASYESSLLRTHIKSIHEEEKFPCESCDYLATLKSNLRTHIKSIH